MPTPTAVEPRTCERCAGTGYTESYHWATGPGETRCLGIDDADDCTDGLVYE